MQRTRTASGLLQCDLVPHCRLVKLRVEGPGPATVGIDAQGGSLYESLARDTGDHLPEILDALADARRQGVPRG